MSDFLPLNQTTRNWHSMASSLNGNVYAGTDGGDIYMQTNGVGNFLPLSQTSRSWTGMTSSNGNVYAAGYSGDIYMQTNGVGNFIALSQTSRNWLSMTSSNGNVYAGNNNGDIYMQTSGIGDFLPLSQTSRNWRGMASLANGNVYAADYGGDIYMQTNGVGNFIALSQTSRNWHSMTSSNGNVYAGVNNGDIYIQTNGVGNFLPLSQISRNWLSMASFPSGNVYAADYGGDIYKMAVDPNDYYGLSLGIIAAYNFPDTGTTAIDECGENNDIPLTNTTWSSDGLVVNATGEYGVLDNTGNNVVNSEAGTICFYIKGESSLPMSTEVVIFGTDTATDGAILLYIDSSDRLFFELYDSVGSHVVRVDYPKIPNWGTGTLISICWDRSNIIAFGDNMVIGIDGVYIEPDWALNETSWNTFTVESSLGFLNLAAGGAPINGACKNSFFYNIVKIEYDLALIYNNMNGVIPNLSKRLSTGISASYKLDEGQGPTAFDSSGNNNNATINGTIWNAAGIECDADYEYALIDNSSEAVVASDFGTVIVYFTSNGIPNDGVDRSLFGNYHFTEGRFWIVKSSDNHLYLSTRDSTTVILVANNYPILSNWQTGTQISGVWNHESPVHGSSHLVLNVDGVHLTPDTGQNNTTAWASYQTLSEMAIGNEAKDKQSECNGIISYCYVFKKVKTEEEIRKIFNKPELIKTVLSESLIRRIGCGIGCGI